ncbi:hypothetical protein LPJ66_000659 [Kickxella alabastrina]|uniref:Uncharacterized protein n=1 Tax=Kickxella alabastrina TaxID=61397 RepID=A0ACC1IVJ0_9FUNG|nr:hypothetical protein LPJ66_000659 [Kickxella alabastrina]
MEQPSIERRITRSRVTLRSKPVNTTDAPTAEPKAVPSVNSNIAAHSTVAKPTEGLNSTPSRNIKVLRRTQSEILPVTVGSLYTDNDDDGSDGDLPDASSLLNSPCRKAAPTGKQGKRPRSPGSESGVKDTSKASSVNSKRKRAPAGMLIRSASECLSTIKEDDADDISDISALSVPGELVLALYRKLYYPARIVAQVGPKKFRVEFFDGYVKSLGRANIHTMYEKRFQTCRLGKLQLIGDEPAQEVKSGSRGPTVNGNTNLECDFEHDLGLFAHLIQQMNVIKPHLDRLHECPVDELESVSKAEYRLAAFFGSDSSTKRQLADRVSSGFLNRAEFNFLGRLLGRWYADPPRAAMSENSPTHDDSLAMPLRDYPTLFGDKENTAELRVSTPDIAVTDLNDPTEILSEVSGIDADVNNNAGGLISPTTATMPDSKHNTETHLKQCSQEDSNQQRQESSLALKFVHDVLLPHAVKRMTMERDKCTLEECELRMRMSSSENQWVDHILAARGISRDPSS